MNQFIWFRGVIELKRSLGFQTNLIVYDWRKQDASDRRRIQFDLKPTLNHPIRFMIHVRLIHTNIKAAHTNIDAICTDHEANQAVHSGHQIVLSAFNNLFTPDSNSDYATVNTLSSKRRLFMSKIKVLIGSWIFSRSAYSSNGYYCISWQNFILILTHSLKRKGG